MAVMADKPESTLFSRIGFSITGERFAACASELAGLKT
jgi:hypothetical protein